MVKTPCCAAHSGQARMRWEMGVRPVASRRAGLNLIPWVLLALGAGVSVAQRAATMDPQREQAFALEQQNKTAEAEVAWRGIVKAHPSDGEGYAHLGFLEAKQQRYKEAVPLYRKALALNADMPG